MGETLSCFWNLKIDSWGHLPWPRGACPGAVGETEAIFQKEVKTEMRDGGQSVLGALRS